MSIQPDLNDAILEAAELLRAIDMYDVHSDIPEQVEEFNGMIKDHNLALEKVMELAIQYRQELDACGGL